MTAPQYDATAVRERRPLPYPWPEVRARLQGSIVRLLPALGIRERPAGGLVTPLNPTRADKRPGSFVIWTGGDRAGAWRDYATGDSGDVIDLVRYLLSLRTRTDAYWWSLEFLGLDRGVVRQADAAQRDRERAERDRIAAEAKAAADAANLSRRCFAAWSKLAPIAGTLAETYLREERGIALNQLKQLPPPLRFSRGFDHLDGKSGEVTRWPCMVGAVTRGSEFLGLHHTWLAPDGLAKAPVDTPKKMRGPVRGGAIRLTNGASGLPPIRAAAEGALDPLIIGEGIETTLTAATARPEYRAWAAGSLSLLGLIDWPACASAVILLRDNDEGGEAQRAFERAEAHWRRMAQGRPVKVVASAVGKDFNDWGRS